MSLSTRRDTVKLLLKSILNRLENQKAILFPANLRAKIQDEIYDLVGPFVLTDQDLHERTLEKIGATSEQLAELEATQNAQYRTARSIIRKTFGDDELNGFYFQKSLKVIASQIREYLLESSQIEEVFLSDGELDGIIVESVKRFNPHHPH